MRPSSRLRAVLHVAAVTAVLGCSEDDPTSPGDESCNLRGQVATGSSVAGELTAGDCASSGGVLLDHYDWSAIANQAVEITLTSSAFNPVLLVSNGPATAPVAQNGDASASDPNSRVKLITRLGLHTVTATTLTAGATGSYVLSITGTAESAENCETVFIEPTVSTTQSLVSTDCMLFAQFFDDQYRIFLAAGERVRITMRSTEFNTFLQLYAPSGTFIAEDDDSGGGGDAQIVATAPVSGFFILSASSSLSGRTGAYTLAVEPVSSSAGTQLAPGSSLSMRPRGARSPLAAN